MQIDRADESEVMTWRSEKVFQNQFDIFTSMLADIRQAKISVDFETFIFELDDLGFEILDSLRKDRKSVV